MRPAARAGRLLFVLALGVYAFSAGGSLTSTDAVVTFDVTRNIVEHGSVAMSGNLLGMEAHRGPDGRYYSPFGIGQSLYNVPFYLAGKAAVALTGLRVGKSDSVLKACVALGQTFVAAAIVREAFLLGVAVTGDSIAAALAALTLAFGSILWPYARFGFNQPLACFTLLAATRQAWLGVRDGEAKRLAAAGSWLAASLLTRHEMAIAAVPLAAWAWFDGRVPIGARVRRLAAFLPPVLAGVVCWAVLNAIRFGNPLDAGYLRDPHPGFGSPVAAGIAALLLSPSASLFLYSPVALAGLLGLCWMVRRGDRSTALLFLSLAAAMLVFYASLGNWLGGRSYGSRYLLVIVPYCALGWAMALSATSPVARRFAFALMLAVGLVVQMPGVLMDYAKVGQAAAAGRPFTTEQRQWDWHASALSLNSRALAAALPANLAYVLAVRPIPRVDSPRSDDDRGFSQRFAFSLDLWWLYLFYLRVLPRWALAAMVAGFALFVTVCARQLVRVLAPTREPARVL